MRNSKRKHTGQAGRLCPIRHLQGSFSALLLLVSLPMVHSQPAQAGVIGPGICTGNSTVACPGALTVFSDSVGVFQSGITTTFSNPINGAGGTFRMAVYLNGSGTLDFYYQLTDAGTVSMDRLYGENFAGFITDVGVRTDDFDGAGVGGVNFLVGTQGPVSIDRGSSGIEVGANFLSGGPTLDPGETSYVLEVRTNATQFTVGGTIGAQHGSSREQLVSAL